MEALLQDFSKDMLKPRNLRCRFEGVLQKDGPLKGWYWIQELKILEENATNIKGLPVLHSGFNDGHVHLSWMGEQFASLQAPKFSSARDLRESLEKRFQNGTSQVESAYSFEETLWKISLEALGEEFAKIPRDFPWILFRICGHKALVSAEVLRRSGLEAAAEKPKWLDAGKIFQLYRWLEVERVKRIPAFVLRAQEELLSRGYSAVSDMAWDSGKAHSIIDLHRDGKILLDVAGVLHAGTAPELEREGPFWIESPEKNSVTQNKIVVTCRHWKKFLDGSFGARTALLSTPYSDDANEFGRDLCEARELIGEAEAALSRGFHLSFHAIGDAAIDRVIEVEEMLQNLLSSRRRLSAQKGLPACWHRIEHAQLVRDAQLDLLAQSKNWMVCAQPFHRVMDQSFIEARLGRDRLQTEAYRFASLVRAKLPVVLSSDGPIGSTRPEEVIRAVVADPREGERLDPLQTLWLFTRGSRALLGLPDRAPTVGSFAWLSEEFSSK